MQQQESFIQMVGGRRIPAGLSTRPARDAASVGKALEKLIPLAAHTGSVDQAWALLDAGVAPLAIGISIAAAEVRRPRINQIAASRWLISQPDAPADLVVAAIQNAAARAGGQA